jgi:putative transposase
VPSPIVIALRAEEQAAILAQLRQARYGHLLSLHILLLLSHRYSPTDIAAALFCSRSSVYRTVEAWQAGQIEVGSPSGLPRRWWGCCLTASLQAQLLALVEQSPRALGWMRTRWSCACLAAELRRLWGWRPSSETVRRWLHQSGYVWKRASLIARDDDPDRDGKLARIRQAWRRLGQDEALLFADEMDVDLLPKVGSQWTRKGERVTVPTPGKNQKTYVGAALDFCTGRLLCRTGWKKNRFLFLSLLEAILRCYPAEQYRRVWVVADNYRIHDALVIRQWLASHPHIGLLWLPRYCPQANPIERVFGDVHDTLTRNHRYQTLPELTAAVLRHWRGHRWWHATLPSVYTRRRDSQPGSSSRKEAA